MMYEKNKVLAVASIGGHWMQLLRIIRGLQDSCDVVYMSTHEKCATMVEGYRFYKLQDFSRWDAYKAIPVFWRAWKVVIKENPNVVITTGATPGLIVLIVAKMCFKRTIWIDSIANVNRLSACGRIAAKIATKTYTQWENLAKGNIEFAGNVLEEIEK